MKIKLRKREGERKGRRSRRGEREWWMSMMMMGWIGLVKPGWRQREERRKEEKRECVGTC